MMITELETALLLTPRIPSCATDTAAPLLTIRVLPLPLLPRIKFDVFVHSDPPSASEIALLFAVMSWPTTALLHANRPPLLTSTRLPEKPLADIAGLPMIVRVAQRAAASSAQRIVVAADHASIVQVCKQHGVEGIVTRDDHASGSDRLAQACEILGLDGQDAVVNVQGDEPLMDPALIDAVAALLDARPNASMSTAAHAIDNVADLSNPNVVKVVLDAQGMAMYFSRATIPWSRDAFASGVRELPAMPLLRHVGIYGYRAGFLRKFAALAPTPLERAEALEQLRALEYGYRIAVRLAPEPYPGGVDTAEDLERVRALLGK